MPNRPVSIALAFALIAAVPVLGDAQSRPRRVGPLPAVAAHAPGESRWNVSTSGASEPEMVVLEGSLVEVPVVVSDRRGHYIPRLRRSDFRVLEDGVEHPITFFIPERVPFHVALLIDTSESTLDTLPEIRRAAMALIQQLGPGDRALIISFAEEILVLEEFTHDKHRLNYAVQNTSSSGKTRLYDAVYAAVAQRLAGVDGRKAMVILSDGQDTASRNVSFQEAADACFETNIVVYGVRYPESSPYAPSVVTIPHPAGYSYPFSSGGGGWRSHLGGAIMSMLGASQIPPIARGGRDPFMEAITSNSGGALYYAESIDDVAELCTRIAEELRHVYTLGYQPERPLQTGGYRRISVELPSRPDAAIRHRLGYRP